MSDMKLRCALVYRICIDAGSTVLLAKYDHASQYETHRGAATHETALYGGRDEKYAEAVAKVIEYDLPSGLAEAGTIGGFKVVRSDRHQVVYGADSDGICMGVITGLEYKSHVAIQMLQELYKDFMEKFGADAKTAGKGAFNKKASKLLSNLCGKYDDLNKVDKASSLMSKVDQVQLTMQSNIADMLKNVEQADRLVEKSDQLQEQAKVFKKGSANLRKQMLCKDFKMTLILGGIIIIVLAVVILAPILAKARKEN